MHAIFVWEVLMIGTYIQEPQYSTMFPFTDAPIRSWWYQKTNLLVEVFKSGGNPEDQKPRQRVSVANRKIFARPENICADGI